MKKTIVILMILCLAGVAAFAATSSANHSVTLNVPEVVLVGLNSGTAITLNVVAPATAGNAPTGQTDATKYLNYTAVNAGGTLRNITVQWGGADAAPAGTSLKVVSAAPTGTGTVGSATAQRTISAVAQTVVTGIGSCYTATGSTGANLTYTLSVDTPQGLVQGDNHTVTVTYTLTDAS